MSSPEKRPRLDQLREDVDGAYDLLTDTNTRVHEIAATQTRHGVRLDGIDLKLVGIDIRLDRLEQGQSEHSAKMAQLDGKMAQLDGKVDRLEEGQREQGAKIDSLDSKMDRVLTLLTDDQSGD